MAACRDPRNHRYTPAGGLPELQEAIAAKTAPRLRATRSAPARCSSPTAASTPSTTPSRRCSTPATRCSCRPRTGPPTPSRSRLAGGVPVDAADRRDHRLPGHRRPARGGAAPTAPRSLRVRVALEPDRRGVPRRTRSRPSAAGRSSAASGSSPTRSTSTSPTATTEFSSMPTAGARAGRPLRRAQRRGQDLRHDRLAGRVDDRAAPTSSRPPPTCSPTPRPTWPTSPSAPRWPRCPATSTPWPRCVRPSTAAAQRCTGCSTASTGVTCIEPQGAFYTFPSFAGVLGREIDGPQLASPPLELADVLLDEAKVAIVPGEAFAAPGLRPAVLRARRRRPRRGHRAHRRPAQRSLTWVEPPTPGRSARGRRRSPPPDWSRAAWPRGAGRRWRHLVGRGRAGGGRTHQLVARGRRRQPTTCCPTDGTRATRCTSTAAARGPSATAWSCSATGTTSASIASIRAARPVALTPEPRWPGACATPTGAGPTTTGSSACGSPSRCPRSRRGGQRDRGRRPDGSAGRPGAGVGRRLRVVAPGPRRSAGVDSGTTRACHGTAPSCGWPRRPRADGRTGRSAPRSPAGPTSRSSSRSGRPTARWSSCPTATGWWNVCRDDGPTDPQPVVAVDAEIGRPQWVFGLRWFAPLDDGTRRVQSSPATGSRAGRLEPTAGRPDRSSPDRV